MDGVDDTAYCVTRLRTVWLGVGPKVFWCRGYTDGVLLAKCAEVSREISKVASVSFSLFYIFEFKTPTEKEKKIKSNEVPESRINAAEILS